MGVYSSIREAGDCLALTICFFLCTGPILLLAGIGLLASAGTDDRGPRLDRYSAAVSTWISTGAAAFTGRSFSLIAPSTTFSQALLPAAFTGADPVAVDSSAAQYSRRINYLGSQAANLSPLGTVALPCSTSPSVQLQALSVTDAQTGLSASLNVPMGWCISSFPCVAGDSQAACATKCSNAGGSSAWTGIPSTTPCNIRYALTEVCLVLANASLSGGQLLDSSAQYGFGCSIVDGRATSAGGASRTGALLDAPRLGPYNFLPFAVAPASPAVRFTLRSNLDPYVTALRLTGGSPGSFGLTMEQKLTTGFALLGLGIALCFCVASTIAAIARGQLVCCMRPRQTTTYHTGPIVDYGAKPAMTVMTVMPTPVLQRVVVGVPQQVYPQQPVNPYSQPAGYPLQQQASGYPPQAAGYPQQQQASGYPPQAAGYPQQQQASGYPPQAAGYPQQQASGFPSRASAPPAQGYDKRV
jgi:hypothetical protein